MLLYWILYAIVTQWDHRRVCESIVDRNVVMRRKPVIWNSFLYRGKEVRMAIFCLTVAHPRPLLQLLSVMWKRVSSNGGMILTETDRQTGPLGVKLVTGPLCPPQVPRGMIQARIWAFPVADRWLTASALRRLYIHSFFFLSALLQVRSPFQSQICTRCVLVLPHSVSSTLSFPQGQPVAAYVFFLIFPSLRSFPLYLSFNNVF
jgi:hypothetical protein